MYRLDFEKARTHFCLCEETAHKTKSYIFKKYGFEPSAEKKTGPISWDCGGGVFLIPENCYVDLGFVTCLVANIGMLEEILLKPPFHQGIGEYRIKRWPGSFLVLTRSEINAILEEIDTERVQTLLDTYEDALDRKLKNDSVQGKSN